MKQKEMFKKYIEMIANKYVNSLICYSRTGLGKTYETISTLNKLCVSHKYINGVATPLSLYKMLYDNNGKVIVLDDIEMLFNNENTISILKAASWDVDNERVITYNSNTSKLEAYPQEFTFTGQIIILLNDIKHVYNNSFKALMSRCLTFNLTYTLDEIKRIARSIIAGRNDLNSTQKHTIYEIIDNDIRIEHEFNFRLLERLVAFVKYDMHTAREMFINSLDVDEDTQVISDIINTYNNAKQQVRAYNERTGKSRMTFFRKKKQLKKERVI